MTPQECAALIRKQAAGAGMTPKEFADRFNRLTHEEIAQAMEALPTGALECGVRFEAAENPAPRGGRKGPDQPEQP